MNAASFRVGEIEVELVSDGEFHYPVEDSFLGASAEELRTALSGQLDEAGLYISPYTCSLVRAAGKLALIDGGLGEHAADYGDTAGKLRESLERRGVTPADVHIVVITHAHSDHIGGLTASSGGVRKPVFGRVPHFISKVEWDFWTSEENLAPLPVELSGAPRVHFPALAEAGVVETIEGEAEILPGVSMGPAPGHTVGHVVVSLEAGSDRAFYLADTVTHQLTYRRPEVTTAYEQDRPAAIETRRRLLGRAADEKRLVAAFHMAGYGRCERAGDAFRYVKVT